MEGAALWNAIASGEVSLRELANVDDASIARIRGLGVTAFTCGRHEQAAKIFAGLEALDPKEPRHALYLGHALSALGKTFDAREALTRFIDAESRSEISRVELVRALLFRASLETGLGNTASAAEDIARAKERARGDAEATALLTKMGVAS